MRFAHLAQTNGDDLTAQLLREYGLDSLRSRTWSSALARYAVTARPDNSDVIANWESKWHASADQAMAGLATIFNDAPTPTDPADVLTKVKQFYIQFRASYTVDS